MELTIEKNIWPLEKSMNSIVNLNNTWTAENFLNCIDHDFSGTVANWYDSLDEKGKHILRMMETPSKIKENKTDVIEAKLNFEKMLESGKERLVT